MKTAPSITFKGTKTTMPSSTELLPSIKASPQGVALAELLKQHPNVARRTAQRQIAKFIDDGLEIAHGEDRARRYFGVDVPSKAVTHTDYRDVFPAFIPVSADSQEPAGTYSRAILNRLLIDLSWASSHLEGNTYSRLDTRELIEHGRSAQGKAAIETQMILNHKSTIELLVEDIDSAEFNHYTLMNIHGALSENLPPNSADEGMIRRHAFEQSFFMMVHLPYLQPFTDINKRTSRLAANLPLFRTNLCPLTFLDVPEQAYNRATLGIYEMARVELLRDFYVWAYEHSTQEYLIKQGLAEPDPLRLTWRDFIKQTIYLIVTSPEQDPYAVIQQAVKAKIPESEQKDLQALVIEELRRLHEGVLARYGLRLSEFSAWKAEHQSNKG